MAAVSVVLTSARAAAKRKLAWASMAKMVLERRRRRLYGCTCGTPPRWENFPLYHDYVLNLTRFDVKK
jgi:hypothetical protein